MRATQVDRGERAANDVDRQHGAATGLEHPVRALAEFGEHRGGHLARAAVPHPGVDQDRRHMLRPKVQFRAGVRAVHGRHQSADVTTDVEYRRPAVHVRIRFRGNVGVHVRVGG